ncbi:hypothetical protein GOODEAATRI_029406, partial [Goodea atripinnis]
SVENVTGQHTPKHQRLARSISNPLCKTLEPAQADGDRKEGQKERRDQRMNEALQGRRRGEPVTDSASLLLLSSLSSGAAVLGEPASSSHLLSAVVGRQQGFTGSGRTWTKKGPASVVVQGEPQNPQPQAQHHGLLAKGVRLIRNMGNQETKQKKGGGSGGAAGDVSCDCEADEREVDKQSKKANNKARKGGEHSAKNKIKPESKGSVFSGMKIRKSLSKVKGLSKDDTLGAGKSADELKPGTEASFLPDEMGMVLDVEGDLSHLIADSCQSVEDFGRKTSSESDTDLYSFHSAAAETDDLLSDIQQAIQEKCIASSRVLETVPRPTSEGLIYPVSPGRRPAGTHKSASSLDLSLVRDDEEKVRPDFLPLERRKSSMSISHLMADGLPVSQTRRTSATSPSTVKLYPPVHPSYVKTTTRQLTSPVGSPLTSPNVPRKREATNASLESSRPEGLEKPKQRSSSITGPYRVSGDWSAELDLVESQTGVAKPPEQETTEKCHTVGTYWTLGSKRAQYGKRTSTTPYLDVFSGESHAVIVIQY